MCPINDIFTYYAQLPPAVKGVVEPDENGDYTIYINSLYNVQQCLETFNHEMRHILLRHFDVQRPIEELEAEADDRAALLTKIRRAAASGLPLSNALFDKSRLPRPAQAPPTPPAPPPRGSFVRPRPKRETARESRARLLSFMQAAVLPKYGNRYAWVQAMEERHS